MLHGKKIEIIAIPKPPGHYIILEALKKDKTANKGVNVISFCNKTSIKIGRGHDSEFRISDISVSRFHAQIVAKNGSFILEDHTSKFGTLIQVKRPLAVDQSNELCV
jgi:pSer/pThr/pTyr-binding forkhead associated (FHA) protein